MSYIHVNMLRKKKVRKKGPMEKEKRKEEKIERGSKGEILKERGRVFDVYDS